MTGIKVPVEINPELVKLERKEDMFMPYCCPTPNDTKEMTDSEKLDEGVSMVRKLGGDYYHE